MALQPVLENPEGDVLRVPLDGLLETKIYSEIPGSRKESVTTITYRVHSSTTTPSATQSGPIYLATSTKTPENVVDVVIDSGWMGSQLDAKLTSNMRAVQSNDVIYRKMNFQVFNKLTWDNITPANATAELNDVLAQTANVNSNLQEASVHKLKCASGLTGSDDESSFVQPEAASIRCYVRGMNNYGDKPSRFFILGSTLRTSRDAFASQAIQNIQSHLTKGMTFTVSGIIITFVPVFLVAGAYRPCNIAQIEGIRSLAGSRARKMEGKTKPDTGRGTTDTGIAEPVIRPRRLSGSRRVVVPPYDANTSVDVPSQASRRQTPVPPPSVSGSQTRPTPTNPDGDGPPLQQSPGGSS